MTDAWEEVEEAVELLEAAEFDAALAELDRIIAQSPKNELAHAYRGAVLFERRDFAEALTCYVRALGLAPRFLAAMVGAGQCLRYLGEHDKAIRMAREALKVRADDPDALFLAAAVTFQRGERHASVQYLERFLATGPEAEAAIEAHGMLRILNGDTPDDPDADDEDDA